MEQDVKIFMNYRRLKDIRRCNNFPTISTEDVAQHSYYVSLLALTLAIEYNDWAARVNMKFHPYDYENKVALVDVDKVLRMAISHDLEEAFTSDIPWNIKHYSEELNAAINSSVQARMESVYSGSRVMRLFHKWNQDCKKGLEGQFVDLADMLELAVYSYEECAKGNTYMEPMLYKSIGLIEEMSIYPQLSTASPMLSGIIAHIKSPILARRMIDID